MNNSLRAVSGGTGDDVILLHGLFGQGSNLRGIARSLEARFRVHCLDLPDHGRSPWLASATLPAYARSVLEWMASNEMGKCHIIGHSLGGKVAMQLALSDPERVRGLVVADIAPVPYPSQHGAILAAMARVQAGACKTRAEAEAILAEAIPEPEVRAYLLMSLVGGDGGYRWRFNLEGLTAGYDQLRAAPESDVASGIAALFLRGGESRYVENHCLPEIERLFPQSRVQTVSGAGHWLHIDRPREVHDAIARYLIEVVGD